ncbi:MAG: universal stress protein [Halanaeroarchaeum sp.]
MADQARAIDAILVPIDDSDVSFRALTFAVDMAERYGGALAVAHLTTDGGSQGADPAGDAIRQRARSIVEGADVDATIRILPDLTDELRHGEAVGQAIVDLVLAEGYDHVVMGHRGTGAVEGALAGSAVTRVVDSERVPVTVVP